MMSNGLPRESIGQTQPERNPSLLVRYAIRMTFYEKKNLLGIMVNVVPRVVPRPKPSGPAAPWVLALGLGTTFTMITPRLFQIMSQCTHHGEYEMLFLLCKNVPFKRIYCSLYMVYMSYMVCNV